MDKRSKFQFMHDSYTSDDKDIIVSHLTKALSNLKQNAVELEIAAAINDYVYQYFIAQDNYGNAAKLLKDGHALCDGMTVTMMEMLHSVGIKANKAFLIGIPIHSGHSLVEVFFNDGTRGLFDPTYGLLFYDEENHAPISILDLFDDPSLVKTKLYKSVHQKRKGFDNDVLPFNGLSKSYKSHHDYKIYYEDGVIYFDPYLFFTSRIGGGVVGDGCKIYITIPLEPGVVIGQKMWHPDSQFPWSDLARLKDRYGNYIPWAYMLGKTHDGYSISHVYQLDNLIIGQDYVLKIYYSEATNVSLSIHLIRNKMPSLFRKIANKPNLWKSDAFRGKFEPGVTEFRFIAISPTADIILDTDGYMIINAIELELYFKTRQIPATANYEKLKADYELLSQNLLIAQQESKNVKAEYLKLCEEYEKLVRSGGSNQSIVNNVAPDMVQNEISRRYYEMAQNYNSLIRKRDFLKKILKESVVNRKTRSTVLSRAMSTLKKFFFSR